MCMIILEASYVPCMKMTASLTSSNVFGMEMMGRLFGFYCSLWGETLPYSCVHYINFLLINIKNDILTSVTLFDTLLSVRQFSLPNIVSFILWPDFHGILAVAYRIYNLMVLQSNEWSFKEM